jgi:hypothetical protein
MGTNFDCFALFSHKILPNANDQKEYRLMVVIVFRFYRRIDSSYCSTLGMADADPALPVYLLRQGDGFIVR